jgi:mannose-6-phosphate isomerase-like protein (cupin superfamily)
VKTIIKPWGREEIITVQEQYVVKRLHINSGQRCSRQYHKKKTETIIVLSGILLLHINDKAIIMEDGDSITIFPHEEHRMEGGNGIHHAGMNLGSGNEPTIYLECSTTELDDVVRTADDYGRE